MSPRASAQRAWWADVEEVKERIERRQASERERGLPRPSGARRTVSITGRPAEQALGLRLVGEISPPAHDAPMRSRRRPPLRVIDRIGTRPDRIAAWAVLLGVALVLATLLSAHG